MFSQTVGGQENVYLELFTLIIADNDLQQLTHNSVWDLYPVWSSDDTQVAFLSWRGETLDIYLMALDGTDQRVLHDSGTHDADIHWVGDQIVFTAFSQIWIVNGDGTGARQLTDPPRAGEWGKITLKKPDLNISRLAEPLVHHSRAEQLVAVAS
ncbi:MAG: hypothetical protein GYB65_09575 [Chloroflexi bacterium]|nr:hypothetical protein [Chloroflexota bacterium]